MKNTEKLYLAIGEIDDQLIEEASSVSKKSNTVVKILAIAASLAIVTVGVITAENLLNANMKGSSPYPESNGHYAPSAPSGGSDPSDGSPDFGETPPPEMDDEADPPESGDVKNNFAKSDFGSILVTDLSSNKLSFVLTIESTAPSEIDFYLYSADRQFVSTSADGVEGAVATRPKISVNGVLSDSLPGSPGVYVIDIELNSNFNSETEDLCPMPEISWENQVYFVGFGNILIER